MLSGRSPFLALRPKEDSASAIMKRIRSGDYKMDADSAAWKHVSAAAKQLVRGLLTVDPKKRLNLDDLFNSAWIKLAASAAAIGARNQQLLSPSVLNEGGPLEAERNLMQTFNAFHRVTREGGMAHLRHSSGGGGNNNPSANSLLRSIRCKQNSSASSSSGCSSLSSLSNSSSLSPTKQLLHPPHWPAAATSSPQHFFPGLTSTSSMGSSLSNDSGNGSQQVLNFRTSSRIHDYLNSLSQIQQSSSSNKQSPPVSPSSHHHHLPFAEALSGVSYRLLPMTDSAASVIVQSRRSPFGGKDSSSTSTSSSPSPSSSATSHSPTASPSSPIRTCEAASSGGAVSITPVPPLPLEYCQRFLAAATVTAAENNTNATGPMTRSRKRKLKDTEVSLVVSQSPSSARAKNKKIKSGIQHHTVSAAVSITAINPGVVAGDSGVNGGSVIGNNNKLQSSISPVSLTPVAVGRGPAPPPPVTITLD